MQCSHDLDQLIGLILSSINAAISCWGVSVAQAAAVTNDLRLCFTIYIHHGRGLVSIWHLAITAICFVRLPLGCWTLLSLLKEHTSQQIPAVWTECSALCSHLPNVALDLQPIISCSESQQQIQNTHLVLHLPAKNKPTALTNAAWSSINHTYLQSLQPKCKQKMSIWNSPSLTVANRWKQKYLWLRAVSAKWHGTDHEISNLIPILPCKLQCLYRVGVGWEKKDGTIKSKCHKFLQHCKLSNCAQNLVMHNCIATGNIMMIDMPLFY